MTFLERIRRRRALTAEAKELLSEAVADGMIDTDAIEEVNQELGERASGLGIGPLAWVQLILTLLAFIRQIKK